MTLYAKWKSVTGPVTLVTPTVPAGVFSALDRHGANTGTCWDFDDGTLVSYTSPDLCFAYNQPFSISIWFMPRSLPSSGWCHIVAVGGVPGQFNYFLAFDGPKGGDLVANIGKSGTAPNEIPCHVSATMWHHAVMVYDGSEMVLYVDGASRGTVVYSFGAAPTPTTAMTFGGGDSNYFDGSIGELTVYDRAISADEVAALAAN
jgi:hypothetical protein